MDGFYDEVEQKDLGDYLVMEFEEGVIGYVGCWIVIDEGEIRRMGIKEDFGGNGLGELLLK
ncbi:GNAT family N-acetyltransferase [Staphylococcus auricularis]|uniref:GNAT family N-acetyltransferase n=1 Tax=Staphylococcus auricularis TaxID=29379 RepID=UPI003850394C